MSHVNCQKKMRDNKLNVEEKLCSSVPVTTGDKERSRVPPSIPVLDRHPTSLKQSYAETCRRSESVDVIDEIIQGSISTFGDIDKSKLLVGNQPSTTRSYILSKRHQSSMCTSYTTEYNLPHNKVKQRNINSEEQKPSSPNIHANSTSIELQKRQTPDTEFLSKKCSSSHAISQERGHPSEQTFSPNEKNILTSTINNPLYTTSKVFGPTNRTTLRLSNEESTTSKERIYSNNDDQRIPPKEVN